MKVLKEIYITNNYRVRMSKINGEYEIETQQNTICLDNVYPWEAQTDGWRNCSFYFCSNLEKAMKEFAHAIDFAKRMNR